MDFFLMVAYAFLMIRASYSFCMYAFNKHKGWLATGYALEIVAIVFLVCKAV